MISFLKTYKLIFAKIAAALLALAVWQFAAMAVGEELILVTPIKVFLRLFTIWGKEGFLSAVFLSFARITLGFLFALLAGTVLAVLAGNSKLAEILLSPYMITVKTVPVASFIVLAYVWFSASSLSAFISFLIVLPTVYTGMLTALRSTPKELKEMAELFAVSFPRKLLTVYLPHMRPYVLSSCALAAGLAWKSGVAAEIITMPSDSLGNFIYYAKLWLETVDLYTYTVVIVLLSIAFEKLFCLFLRLAFDALERLPRHTFRAAAPLLHRPAQELTVKEVSKSFGNNTVLKDFGASFASGKITCLMAPSGAGKTTLLRIMAKLEKEDSGEVRGNENGISMVFQEDRLSKRLCAAENAMLGKRGATRKEAEMLLKELGLDGHLDKPVSSLSGGMRRRVAIARALLSDAPLLLLDEALKGLDHETKAAVAAVIRKHASGKTVIAVTHDEEDIALLGAEKLLLS